MYEDDRRTASLESGTLRVAKHLARLDAMGLRKTSGLTYLSRARSPSNSSPRVSKIAEELQTLYIGIPTCSGQLNCAEVGLYFKNK